MNMKQLRLNHREEGSSLVLVIVIIGISVLLVSGVLSWTSTNSGLVQRSNQYLESAAAAEAATEKVFVNMAKDFQLLGEAGPLPDLQNYVALVPSAGDLLGVVSGILNQSTNSGTWNGYTFADGLGTPNQTTIERVSAWTYTNLLTKHTALKGHAASYRVISNARCLDARHNIVSAVEQKFQIASIPIFQYQFFYHLDLEIHPGANMAFSGRVHSNGGIYSALDLTFVRDVTAAHRINNFKHPDDPLSRGSGQFVFGAEHDSWVNSLNLPIGTSNTPATLRSVIEIPLPLEQQASLIGRQRYYNKADLVIIVTNGLVTVRSGSYNAFAVNIPYGTISSWLTTNYTCFNKRENKTVRATTLDVSAFRSDHARLTSLLGRNPKTVYVADLRSQSSDSQSGVRLLNGGTLPAMGLTIATPNPLYVKGHYNVPDSHIGTTNTTATAPAALVCDAITILSSEWQNDHSALSLYYRVANSTTINAAIVTGIVPTRGGYYSGGVENLIRLLEDWSGRTLTFNGSMVVLYESKVATAPWGASAEVYNAPTRNWSWDANFDTVSKLPPSTPYLRTVIRGPRSAVRPAAVAGGSALPLGPLAPAYNSFSLDPLFLDDAPL